MKKIFIILSVITLVLVLSSCEKPEEVVYDSGEFLVQLSIIENEDSEEEAVTHIVGQSTSDTAVKIPSSIELDDVAKKFGSSGSYRVMSVKGLSAEEVDLSVIDGEAKLELAGKEILYGGLKFQASDDGKKFEFMDIHDEKEHLDTVPLDINSIPVGVSGEYSGKIWVGYHESHKDEDYNFERRIDMIDQELKFMVRQDYFKGVLEKRREQVINDRIKYVGNDTVEVTKGSINVNYKWETEGEWSEEWSEYSGKWVEVDLSDQKLTIHNGVLKRYFKVSTGKSGRETPTGEFPIITRLKLHTMVGDDENKDSEPDYIQEDVPWCTKFTDRGHYIHGAYWHNNFGNVMSHGCVNMKPADAKVVYDFLADVPLKEKNVIVVHK